MQQQTPQQNGPQISLPQPPTNQIIPQKQQKNILKESIIVTIFLLTILLVGIGSYDLGTKQQRSLINVNKPIPSHILPVTSALATTTPIPIISPSPSSPPVPTAAASSQTMTYTNSSLGFQITMPKYDTIIQETYPYPIGECGKAILIDKDLDSFTYLHATHDILIDNYFFIYVSPWTGTIMSFLQTNAPTWDSSFTLTPFPGSNADEAYEVIQKPNVDTTDGTILGYVRILYRKGNTVYSVVTLQDDGNIGGCSDETVLNDFINRTNGPTFTFTFL